MEPLKRRTSAVLLAVTLTTLLGCAASPTRESTGEYLDDAVITTKVKAAILNQPTLKSSEIHVDTYKGTVYLRGVVASQYTVREATNVARSVDGVKSVENDMRVM
ncbi:MAG: BON domain-containing protein [Burkholderiales bacterium]